MSVSSKASRNTGPITPFRSRSPNRDPKKSKHPITRVIAHFGQVDSLTDRDVDNIINGVCKAIGRTTSKDVSLECAWDFGHVFALMEIWKHLKIGTILKQKAKDTGHAFDLEEHIRTMVINRLCDPTSKLGLLQWLQGVYLPGIKRDELEYHHLLRAMDWLIDQKEELEKKIANRLLTLFNQDLGFIVCHRLRKNNEIKAGEVLLNSARSPVIGIFCHAKRTGRSPQGLLGPGLLSSCCFLGQTGGS